MSDGKAPKKEFLMNISSGGICFQSRAKIPIDTKLEIIIPIRKPEFEAEGIVAWCENTIKGFWEIGMEFTSIQSEYRVRMIERICNIEKYRMEVFRKENRKLTGGEAALEWIKKFAGNDEET